ncbi:unnamed protein product [Peniophora sp. CBMAI 1063]|nr:unnamed protein product [Peniophora sp. CBMAI 1063]
MESETNYFAQLTSLVGIRAIVLCSLLTREQGICQLTTFRKLVKASAKSVIKDRPALYPLPEPDDDARNAALKSFGHKSGVIFPHSTAGVPNLATPFEAKAGITVIQDVIKKRKTLFAKLLPSFPYKLNRHSGAREYEVPYAVVALVYTTIYRVLEVKMLGEKAAGPFSAAGYAGTYDVFIADMEKLANEPGEHTHKLFYELYGRVLYVPLAR